ncbi:DNA mismatch repair protein MutS [bacterium]|nr:DNA mismatch repair protein MutS [bacterium]
MMAQYRQIKAELPKDAILLFRLGDFYEMFLEDAQVAAGILNVALTKRGEMPMCGIPYHAANAYLSRLLKAGKKVAICDQVEDAKPGQLVKREVTQILSPGTHFDERMLAAERNNFFSAVYQSGKTYGLAFLDLTTGDFKTTEAADESDLLTELERLRPAEIICPMEAGELFKLLQGAFKFVSGYDDWTFAPETAVYTLKDHFQVKSLDGFGLKERGAAIGAAGGALHYLINQLRRDVKHLTSLSFYQHSEFLKLDHVTLKHLEILEPLNRDAARNATLCGAMNRTVTPMGARRLRDWLTQPLAAVNAIARRQDAVESLVGSSATHEALRDQLKEVRDVERTISRLSAGNGNARDLVALRLALEKIPTIKQVLSLISQGDAVGRRSGGAQDSEEFREFQEEDGARREPRPTDGLLEELSGQLTELPELVQLLCRAIVEEPPLALKDGGVIQDGFDPQLDELRSATRDGKNWIAKLQQDEIERTGITSLKVRFNSVFGYFIEVTKSNLDKVPAEYIRKQTIANGERYITPALKEMEGKILGAEERSTKLEYELFQRVREDVLARLADIQRTAAALAQLDVLGSFAETARLYNYVRPQIGDTGELSLRDGRHPVLEQSFVESRFVPNDTELCSGSSGRESAHSFSESNQSRLASAATECGTTQIMLITGPNMAGKSTYIRQVALLTLLAHTGSFLPAAEARVDLVDRIFTRIGASDDLARGQSTFMVEMSETANILNNATERSLVILDEIGRGTSTFDGLSLAWSIVEHLHNQVGAKTLFATHYHELTELTGKLKRLQNFNVAVREWNDQIVFLHKIVEGGTDKSYGIQVARLAGVPKEVIDRAKVILRNLEDSELTPEGNVRRSRKQEDRDKLKQIEASPQLDLFE